MMDAGLFQKQQKLRRKFYGACPSFAPRVLFFVILATTYYLLPTTYYAFASPPPTPGYGSGAISVNAAGNLGIGTSTPSANVRLLIVASSTDSSNFALQVVQPGSAVPLLVVRNDGTVGIGTSNLTNAGSVNLASGMSIYGSVSGLVSAGNISPGVFNSLQLDSGVPYGFPHSVFITSGLGITTTTASNLPQALSVYGGGYFSGNVGIGTANPTQQLQLTSNMLLPMAAGNVNGNLFFGGDTSVGVNGMRLFSSDSSGGGFIDVKASAATNGLIFRVDTSAGAAERMRITAGGNVGIGTTGPASLFSVGASSQFQVDNNGNIAKINSITYSWPAAQGGASTVLTNNGAGTLSWSAAGGSVTSVSDSGVGTLTISPTAGAVSAALNLGHANTWTALQTFSSGASANTLTVSGISGSIQCLHVSAAGVVSGTGSDCASSGGTVNASNVAAGYFGSNVVSTGNYLFPASVVVSSSLAVATSGSAVGPQALSVYGGGYFTGSVGIGTAAPGYKLDVEGGFLKTSYNTQSLPVSDGLGGLAVGWNYTGGNAEVDFYNVYNNPTTAFQFSEKTGASSKTDLVTILGSGNVGIGTASPATTLHVVNGSKFAKFDLTSNGTDALLQLGPAAVANWARIGSNGSPMAFLTQGSDSSGASPALFINNNGNVGIGNTAPVAKLDIQSGSTSTLRLDNTNGSNVDWIKFTTSNGAFTYADLTSQSYGLNLALGTGMGGGPYFSITNGNVGIGNTAPVAKLDIQSGSTSTLRLDKTNGSNVDWIKFTTSNGAFTYADLTSQSYGLNLALGTGMGGGPYFSITNGNVGIGTTAPASTLSVGGAGQAGAGIYGTGSMYGVYGTAGATGYGVYGYGTGNGLPAVYGYNAGTGVGVEGYSDTAGANGSAGYFGNPAGYGVFSTAAIGVYGSGSTYDFQGAHGEYTNNAGQWINSSDERLKKNIVPLSGSLAELELLTPVSFEWKDTKLMGSGEQLGLTAQNVQTVFPQLVETDASGTLGLDYTGLIAPMIESIKEQQQEISALQAQNAALQEKVDALLK